VAPVVPTLPARLRFQSAAVPLPPVVSMLTVRLVPLSAVTTPSV
jgi:hypothetical protein